MRSKYHKKFNSFYSSNEWKVLRDSIRARDIICQHCKKNNIVSQGIEVHHIKPIEKFPELAMNETNLILLCKACHNLEHERASPLSKFFNTPPT